MNAPQKSASLGQFCARLLALGLGVVLTTLSANLFGQQCATVGPFTEGVPFDGVVAGLTKPSAAPAPTGANIDWGDGKSSAARLGKFCFTIIPGTFCIYSAEGIHTYSEAVTGISITVTYSPEDFITCHTAPFDVVSSDVLSTTLTLTTATAGVPIIGIIAAFSDSNTSDIASDFNASINWGDGTITSGTVNGSSGHFSISASFGGHTYATQGSFTVSATLTKAAPGTATSTATGTVIVSSSGAPPPPGPPPACTNSNYQGLWWAAGGTEPGWGINIAQSSDEIFALWYTYNIGTAPFWMSMRCQLKPDCHCTGPLYAGSAPVGTGTFTFADVDNGTFTYNLDAGTGGSAVPVSQTKTISRFDLSTGPQVTCTYDPTADLALATNYQDLWWSGEPGWGIDLTHQGDSVFLAWFTSDSGGAPLWLSALTRRVGTSNVYQGSTQLTSGPRLDAYNAKDLVNPIPNVGTASLTFADGNNATFNFTTGGSDLAPVPNQTKSITRFPFAPGGTICR